MADPVVADPVLYEVAEGVATVSFNRPERNNAMNDAMREAYFDALDQAAADPDVRAIVVTGVGKSFCVGADMEQLSTLGPDQPIELFPEDRPQTYARSIPKPVIAALNGAAAGLGLVHAVACDLRFAAAEIKLTTAFVRRGLIAEYGISWMLPRLVGPAKAFDLLVSGRVIRSEEALELGLVDRVVPGNRLAEAATAYARELAQYCSPTSMAIMKKQIYEDQEQELEPAYARAREELQASLRRPDVVEGVQSYLEKRPPKFPPLSS